MSSVSIPREFPKTDIHWHAEARLHIERMIAQRRGHSPYDWQKWLEDVAKLPVGMARLGSINGDFFTEDERDFDDEAEIWLTVALQSVAQHGASLVEIRFRPSTALRTGFMSQFREAERRVQERYPVFYAEAIVFLFLGRPGASDDFEACVKARKEGLAGIDIIPIPYDSEVDWAEAYGWAERAIDSGLGITAHAGEFSTANLKASMRTTGL